MAGLCKRMRERPPLPGRALRVSPRWAPHPRSDTVLPWPLSRCTPGRLALFHLPLLVLVVQLALDLLELAVLAQLVPVLAWQFDVVHLFGLDG